MNINRTSLAAVLSACLFFLVLFVTFQQQGTLSSFEVNSLKRIQDRGSLIVGVDIPFGIMEFYDEQGKAAGIDIDIVSEISDRLGVQLEIKAMPIEDLLTAIHDRSIDIVASAVTISMEKQKTLLFSQPYLDAGISLAVRADNNTIKYHKDLAGKKVGVLKDGEAVRLSQNSDLFKLSVISSYENNDKRMRDLLEGDIDAAIVNFMYADSTAIKFIGEPLKQSFYGIVTHLDNEALMAGIDNILRDMKRSGILSSIKHKHSQKKLCKICNNRYFAQLWVQG